MTPEIGSKWKHHNGAEYTVIVIANASSSRDEYPVTVVYRGENELVWAKTLDNFLSKMTKVK